MSKRNAKRSGRLTGFAIVAGMVAAACVPVSVKPPFSPLPDNPVLSLFGHELPPPDVEADVGAERSRQTQAARQTLDEALRQGQDDELAWIWLGRRLAYEFRYRDAITVFTLGLANHRESYRLYRHRGHRYISLREFDRAVQDLAHAAGLAFGVPDQTEPDGAPNAAGIPRSTDQSNIYYHLGLAHYLRGEFNQALEAYEQGLVFSAVNDDMLVATSWWTWLAIQRVLRQAGVPFGGENETSRNRIQALLRPIHADMEILENHVYRDLLLLAAGELSVTEVAGDGVAGIQDSTRAYGVAAFHLARGEREAGLALCERIIEGSWWMAFGHIAAEAELWRERHKRSSAD